MNPAAIAYYDKGIADMRATFTAINQPWVDASPSGCALFEQQLASLEAGWALAKVSGEDDKLVRAVLKGGRGSISQDGDFDDLQNRLELAVEKYGVVMGGAADMGIDVGGGSLITGQHSRAQVDDLTVNYDKWIPELQVRFDNLTMWPETDPKKIALSIDLNKLEARWDTAHMLAHADSIANVALPLGLPVATLPLGLSVLYSKVTGGTVKDGLPAELLYQAYLSAIRQGGEGAPIQPSDYLDVQDRIAQAEALYSVKPAAMTPVVQPSSHDQGIEAIKAADSARSEALYWLKLAAVGVGVGLTLQVINNVLAIKRELSTPK